MSAPADGGPAFPVTTPAAEWQPERQSGSSEMTPAHWRTVPGISGMSLRDYFAAKALPAILADDTYSIKDCCDLLGIATVDYEWQEHLPKFCARLAYRFADAMVAERTKATQ